MRSTSILIFIGILGACSGPEEPAYNSDFDNMVAIDAAGEDALRLPPTDEGFSIAAPSDPGASYRILEIKSLGNGNLEVTSRRDGKSGTSFARREISCSSYTYRYLGEGDTLQEARQDGPNPGDMSALTGTSASSDVADAACAKQI